MSSDPALKNNTHPHSGVDTQSWHHRMEARREKENGHDISAQEGANRICVCMDACCCLLHSSPSSLPCAFLLFDHLSNESFSSEGIGVWGKGEEEDATKEASERARGATAQPPKGIRRAGKRGGWKTSAGSEGGREDQRGPLAAFFPAGASCR